MSHASSLSHEEKFKSPTSIDRNAFNFLGFAKSKIGLLICDVHCGFQDAYFSVFLQLTKLT